MTFRFELRLLVSLIEDSRTSTVFCRIAKELLVSFERELSKTKFIIVRNPTMIATIKYILSNIDFRLRPLSISDNFCSICLILKMLEVLRQL
jgi:hypothetical protein